METAAVAVLLGVRVESFTQAFSGDFVVIPTDGPVLGVDLYCLPRIFGPARRDAA